MKINVTSAPGRDYSSLRKLFGRRGRCRNWLKERGLRGVIAVEQALEYYVLLKVRGLVKEKRWKGVSEMMQHWTTCVVVCLLIRKL